MKIFSKLLICGILTTLLINFSVYSSSSSFKETIDTYADDFPCVGLVSDTIKFDGVTIKDFHFDNHPPELSLVLLLLNNHNAAKMACSF